MLNWLKQQATEVSAWAGLALIAAPFLPWPFGVIAGVLAISIDDEKAAKLAKAAGALVGKKIDTVQ